jgi:hypothetical protein
MAQDEFHAEHITPFKRSNSATSRPSRPSRLRNLVRSHSSLAFSGTSDASETDHLFNPGTLGAFIKQVKAATPEWVERFIYDGGIRKVILTLESVSKRKTMTIFDVQTQVLLVECIQAIFGHRAGLRHCVENEFEENNIMIVLLRAAFKSTRITFSTQIFRLLTALCLHSPPVGQVIRSAIEFLSKCNEPADDQNSNLVNKEPRPLKAFLPLSGNVRSIYNANYYCDVQSATLLPPNIMMLEVEAHGDNTKGKLQKTERSCLVCVRLGKPNMKLKPVDIEYTEQTETHIVAKLR